MKNGKALLRLAEFAATTRFEDLPADVIARARWVLRDTLAVILAGMQEPEVHALAEYASHASPGTATLLGHGGRVSPGWAALVHGTAGTSLEMDEGHAFARGHAAIHALPPALALAEAHGLGGRSAITAFVVGYEVAARVGVATHLRPAVHPFGTWGVLGAAATGAWFQRLDGPQMAEALELAASYAIAPSFETAYQGATVRNTYAGLVNRLGLLAVAMVRLGFRGERGGVQTTFGQILGEGFQPEALVEDLGVRYEILRGYFKPYSACRYAHAAVDAILALRAEGAPDPLQIERIEVATYDLAARLVDPAPSTPLGGRFSLPYVTAATLLTGGAGPEIFAPAMLSDARLLDLAARVQVREDPAYTALTPDRRPARVTLHMADGSVLEKAVLGSKGDPDQPMTPSELEGKFHNLVDPLLGAARGSQLWDLLGDFDQQPDLDRLVALCTHQEDKADREEV